MIGRMPNVEQVKAYLGASVDQTQQAVLGMRGVLDELERALAQLRLTAVGSVHPSLLDAINRLEQAKARVEEAQTLASGAADAADAYRAIA
jgi:phage shock protein A